jgi:hypothetical protein
MVVFGVGCVIRPDPEPEVNLFIGSWFYLVSDTTWKFVDDTHVEQWTSDPILYDSGTYGYDDAYLWFDWESEPGMIYKQYHFLDEDHLLLEFSDKTRLYMRVE